MHVPGFMWPVVMAIIVAVFVLIVLICTKDELSAGYGLFSVRKTRPAAIANSTSILQQLEGDTNAADQIQRLQTQIEALRQQLAETTALPAAPVLALENQVEPKQEVKHEVKEEPAQEVTEIKPVAEETPQSNVTQRKPPPPGFRTDLLQE